MLFNTIKHINNIQGNSHNHEGKKMVYKPTVGLNGTYLVI